MSKQLICPTKENVEEIYDLVKKKVDNYDPGKKVESEFGSTDAMGFFDLIGRNSNGCDKLIFSIGCLSSMCFGAALPAFCLLFGGMVNELGSGGCESLQTQALWMIIIGIGVFLVSALQTTLFSIFAENTIFKTKVRYFSQALKKDASFYDN